MLDGILLRTEICYVGAVAVAVHLRLSAKPTSEGSERRRQRCDDVMAEGSYEQQRSSDSRRPHAPFSDDDGLWDLCRGRCRDRLATCHDNSASASRDRQRLSSGCGKWRCCPTDEGGQQSTGQCDRSSGQDIRHDHGD